MTENLNKEERAFYNSMPENYECASLQYRRRDSVIPPEIRAQIEAEQRNRDKKAAAEQVEENEKAKKTKAFNSLEKHLRTKFLNPTAFRTLAELFPELDPAAIRMSIQRLSFQGKLDVTVKNGETFVQAK